jgi:outer membrane protein assembly factor BamB
MIAAVIKRVSLVSFLAISTLATTACSLFDTTPDHLQPMELESFERTAKLKRVWSSDVGTDHDVRYVRMNIGLDGDHIFASDISGRVNAFNRFNGKRQWRIDLDQDLSAGVGVGFGIALVGAYSGEVIALDASSGAELWRTQLSSEILSAPQTNGKYVVVQTQDSKIYGLDATNGEQLWHYENAMPALTLRGTATPVINDSAVYAGFANGKLMAFNPSNGLLLWEKRIAASKGRTDLEKVVDIDGTPQLEDSILYVASLNGRVAAVSRADGRPLWAKEASSHQPLAVSDAFLFLSSSNDEVIAYQASSGLELWVNDQLQRRTITGPQALGDYVAVIDFEGYLHLLNKTNGEFAYRTKVDGDGVDAAMVSVDDLLYILGNDGDLMAYKVAK